ncbi:UDP-glucose dehydrogenase family protein [Pelosinus propionicus]|uniref:UDP-glucose 6-dehydrogenase n=1 Tax=Pelosinus propionicus DSM 13327 TaxID=1123291 RepID=A0A1I4JQP2_9FIRM|nr:UDP-glucose/GDP-mannose dehydrogenase family protein [Pelosinus propionicus]SFL68898.1 UDPglucose 6-dehydrogenase [Pelosinus propionicus DSM 13327]
MKICMIGVGYVGLVTGTCFADKGNIVCCIDTDQEKIKALNSGIIPIYEPGLKDMILDNKQNGRLEFSSDLRNSIADSLLCFITVGTPPNKDGSADLSYVLNAAREIGKCMDNYLIVVTKSTVPVGTTDAVRDMINSELKARGKEKLTFDVASNPEFLKEGTAVADFMCPDRIVIGCDKGPIAVCMRELYKPFAHSENKIITMDIKSAEITKYAANAMLATRISFMNEMAQLCDKLGGDIENIRRGIGTDMRIGSQFLCAGVGYGGSCFPKDVNELIHTGQKNGFEMAIASAVHKVNEGQKKYFVDMIKKKLSDNLQGKKIAVWGLAFKAQTDDMREAPSLMIIEELLKMGGQIAVYDPEAMEQAKQALKKENHKIEYANDMMRAVAHADVLVLITDWQEFREVDLDQLKKVMRQPVIFDGRNQFDPLEMVKHGFRYYCIGRNCYGK